MFTDSEINSAGPYIRECVWSFGKDFTFLRYLILNTVTLFTLLRMTAHSAA